MKNIYFDNGATTFPKPEGVGESMIHYLNQVGGNVGRGSYEACFDAGNMVFETREKLAALFDFSYPENVIFTRNVTESLNLILKGFLQPKDHVLVSSMEHNAVMRPLTRLTKDGISYTRIPCSHEGWLETETLKDSLTPNTRAIIITHASNVSGTIMPLQLLSDFCCQHGLRLIIDAAQTAGVIPLSMKKLKADAICFTGHKGLLGPQGIGGVVLTPEFSKLVAPFTEGGTGSLSDEEVHPDYMPDKFEAGTLNLPGIYGLHAALEYIEKIGLSKIHAIEMDLTRVFLQEVSQIDGIDIIGSKEIYQRTAVVSLVFKNQDQGQICHQLQKKYGIMTRSGMHCAPSAHKTLGTFPEGTVRFSFGHYNTKDEVAYAIKALKEILSTPL